MPDRKNELLLVDDDPSDVELTVHALGQYCVNHTVHVAEDGKEALDYLFCRGSYESGKFNERPWLILLDLKLPKMNGLEVLKEIRGDARTRAIPVVIMTSSKEVRDVVEAYRLGVNGFVQKPVGFDEFRKVVNQIGAFWLDANQPPPPGAFGGGPPPAAAAPSC
jgi:two-component system, response regulator